MGGSYSSLCFTELLRRSKAGSLPGKVILGDLYTHGSPRIGGDDFATALKNNLAPPIGSPWRIFNDGDAIPKVPLVKVVPNPQRFVFVHMDGGYQIHKDKMPSKIDSEIGTRPDHGPPPTLKNIDPHRKSLCIA